MTRAGRFTPQPEAGPDRRGKDADEFAAARDGHKIEKAERKVDRAVNRFYKTGVCSCIGN